MGANIIGKNGINILDVDEHGSGQIQLHDNNGNPIGGSEGSPLYARISTGRTRRGIYACSTFRILGAAAAAQNIASIENPATSGVLIALRRLTGQTDSTALLASVSPTLKTSFPLALPTGGSIIPANPFDSAAPAAVGVVRAGNAADGGAATAIAATPGNIIWSQLIDRMHTAAGYIAHPDSSLLPQFVDNDPLILRPGGSLLVHGVTAIAATTHIIINFAWEEYTQ